MPAGFLDTSGGWQKWGNISAGWILWLENHLVFVAEYDMQRQASCEDGGLYGTHVHIHAHVEEKTQHKTPKEVGRNENVFKPHTRGHTRTPTETKTNTHTCFMDLTWCGCRPHWLLHRTDVVSRPPLPPPLRLVLSPSLFSSGFVCLSPAPSSSQGTHGASPQSSWPGTNGETLTADISSIISQQIV